MEEWRDIPGWEGLYQVSNDGQVRSLHSGRGCRCENGIKNQTTRGWGYKYVNLYKNSTVKQIGVHRLVAMAFIPNKENKPEVNHINGDKADNRVENLEWVTRKENEQHAHRTGLRDSDTRRRSKPVLAINLNTGEKRIYCSANECARKLGIQQGSISRAARGEGKCTKRYDFEYLDGDKKWQEEN